MKLLSWLSRLNKLQFILIGSFLLFAYSLFMYQSMWHNIDLAYNYARLQADGIIKAANYADRAKPLLGDTNQKYALTYLYTESMKWKNYFLILMLFSISGFFYSQPC